VFDLFNTLIGASNSGRVETTRAMGAVLGLAPEQFRSAFANAWHERMMGTLGDLGEQCRRIAHRLGAEPTAEQIDRAVDLRDTFNRRTMVVSDETLSVLSTLRAQGLPLAIVSNCTVDSGAVFAETPLARAVDATVLSYQVAACKPDPRIYAMACDAIGVPPASCVYVGDGADRELYGARDVGMTTYQTTQFAHTDRSWPGPTIGGLAEVPELVANGRPGAGR